MRLKKKTESTVLSGKVLMYGRLVAIAQLAVDKIYHFRATCIHIYIYTYNVFNSILPCNKCLLLLYYQPPPFFRKHFQNPISSESSYAFHPSKRRAAFVNFSLAWREEVHIHWGRLECPLEFCMV